MKRLYKRKGFTLVEVIIVLVIMGIVAVIAVPSVSSYISNTAERRCKALMSDMMSGVRKAVTTTKFAADDEEAVSEAICNQLSNFSSKAIGYNGKNSALIPLAVSSRSVKGETYTVTWSFGGDSVTVTMSCSPHSGSTPEEIEANKMEEDMVIYYGSDISDILVEAGKKQLEGKYDKLKRFINDNKYNQSGYCKSNNDRSATITLTSNDDIYKQAVEKIEDILGIDISAGTTVTIDSFVGCEPGGEFLPKTLHYYKDVANSEGGTTTIPTSISFSDVTTNKEDDSQQDN